MILLQLATNGGGAPHREQPKHLHGSCFACEADRQSAANPRGPWRARTAAYQSIRLYPALPQSVLIFCAFAFAILSRGGCQAPCSIRTQLVCALLCNGVTLGCLAAKGPAHTPP